MHRFNSSIIFFGEQVNWANTSIELSRQNINRFIRILFPPKPEVLSNMCQQGFDDALQFLHRNNLISCTRCLAVQSTFVVQEAIPEAQDFDPECTDCQQHRNVRNYIQTLWMLNIQNADFNFVLFTIRLLVSIRRPLWLVICQKPYWPYSKRILNQQIKAWPIGCFVTKVQKFYKRSRYLPHSRPILCTQLLQSKYQINQHLQWVFQSMCLLLCIVLLNHRSYLWNVSSGNLASNSFNDTKFNQIDSMIADISFSLIEQFV